MVSKIQYLAEKRKEQENYLNICEGIADVLSQYSAYTKAEAYKSMAVFGLIAFGARGLKRLCIQSAQHSIRWYKNPTLPIYAGLGIIMHSTITKILSSIKDDKIVIRQREQIRMKREQLAESYRTSNVVNKS